jgi:hypothetical protein
MGRLWRLIVVILLAAGPALAQSAAVPAPDARRGVIDAGFRDPSPCSAEAPCLPLKLGVLGVLGAGARAVVSAVGFTAGLPRRPLRRRELQRPRRRV